MRITVWGFNLLDEELRRDITETVESLIVMCKISGSEVQYGQNFNQFVIKVILDKNVKSFESFVIKFEVLATKRHRFKGVSLTNIDLWGREKIISSSKILKRKNGNFSKPIENFIEKIK